MNQYLVPSAVGRSATDHARQLAVPRRLSIHLFATSFAVLIGCSNPAKKARELVDVGQYDQAIVLLEQRIRDEPTDVDAFTVLGDTHVARAAKGHDVADYEKAAESYSSALKLAPTSCPAAIGLGYAKIRKGDSASAKPIFEGAKAHCPGAAVVSLEFAWVAAQTADTLKTAFHDIYPNGTPHFDHWTRAVPLPTPWTGKVYLLADGVAEPSIAGSTTSVPFTAGTVIDGAVEEPGGKFHFMDMAHPDFLDGKGWAIVHQEFQSAGYGCCQDKWTLTKPSNALVYQKPFPQVPACSDSACPGRPFTDLWYAARSHSNPVVPLPSWLPVVPNVIQESITFDGTSWNLVTLDGANPWPPENGPKWFVTFRPVTFKTKVVPTRTLPLTPNLRLVTGEGVSAAVFVAAGIFSPADTKRVLEGEIAVGMDALTAMTVCHREPTMTAIQVRDGHVTLPLDCAAATTTLVDGYVTEVKGK